MSANTFNAPVGVNGVNGRQTNKPVTTKIADQLNGASTSSYHHGNGHAGHEDGHHAGLSKVRESARHAAHNAANAASQANQQGQTDAAGLLRGAASKAARVTEIAVQATSATLGYSIGMVRTVGSFYINATAAVIGYSAASAAHVARFGVDTTAHVAGYGVGVAEATVAKVSDKAHHVAGYAVGIVEQGGVIAHATVKKVLPAQYGPRADAVAELVHTAYQHPVEYSKEILPVPIFNTVAWGIGTAVDAKDRTFTTITSTKAAIENTASAVVNTTRSKLQATENFALSTAAQSYEDAKSAVGFGPDLARTA